MIKHCASMIIIDRGRPKGCSKFRAEKGSESPNSSLCVICVSVVKVMLRNAEGERSEDWKSVPR
jgi:hypothetical protein